MKYFYLLFFLLAFLFSSESIKADGQEKKKEVVEEKTEEISEEKEEETKEKKE